MGLSPGRILAVVALVGFFGAGCNAKMPMEPIESPSSGEPELFGPPPLITDVVPGMEGGEGDK